MEPDVELWEEVKGKINTHDAVFGSCRLCVFPLPRKGPFTVLRSELGDSWSADHHALKQATEFGWTVRVGGRVGGRVDPLSLIGEGKTESIEQAKDAALKFLSSWAKNLHLAVARKVKVG